MKLEVNKQILLLISIIVALLLALLLVINNVKKKANYYNIMENMYSVTIDSLVKYKNDLQQEVSKTELLIAENSTQLLSLKTKDREIQRLQNLVQKAEDDNKKVNTALVLSNTTVISLQDSIHNLIIGYSEIEGDSIIYPIYNKTFDTGWEKGKVTLGINTFTLDQTIRNDYDITIGTEKINWFKSKNYAEITNLNPNTETTTMRVYQKETVKNNTFRNILISYGIGFGSGFIINSIIWN